MRYWLLDSCYARHYNHWSSSSFERPAPWLATDAIDRMCATVRPHVRDSIAAALRAASTAAAPIHDVVLDDIAVKGDHSRAAYAKQQERGGACYNWVVRSVLQPSAVRLWMRSMRGEAAIEDVHPLDASAAANVSATTPPVADIRALLALAVAPDGSPLLVKTTETLEHALPSVEAALSGLTLGVIAIVVSAVVCDVVDRLVCAWTHPTANAVSIVGVRDLLQITSELLEEEMLLVGRALELDPASQEAAHLRRRVRRAFTVRERLTQITWMDERKFPTLEMQRAMLELALDMRMGLLGTRLRILTYALSHVSATAHHRLMDELVAMDVRQEHLWGKEDERHCAAARYASDMATVSTATAEVKVRIWVRLLRDFAPCPGAHAPSGGLAVFFDIRNSQGLLDDFHAAVADYLLQAKANAEASVPARRRCSLSRLRCALVALIERLRNDRLRVELTPATVACYKVALEFGLQALASASWDNVVAACVDVEDDQHAMLAGAGVPMMARIFEQLFQAFLDFTSRYAPLDEPASRWPSGVWHFIECIAAPPSSRSLQRLLLTHSMLGGDRADDGGVQLHAFGSSLSSLANWCDRIVRHHRSEELMPFATWFVARLSNVTNDLIRVDVNLLAQLALTHWSVHEDKLIGDVRESLLTLQRLCAAASSTEQLTRSIWLDDAAGVASALAAGALQQLKRGEGMLSRHPVEIAAYLGHTAALGVLLAAGLDVKDADWANTAMELACLKGHRGVIEQLLTAGVAPPGKRVDCPADAEAVLAEGPLPDTRAWCLRYDADPHAFDLFTSDQRQALSESLPVTSGANTESSDVAWVHPLTLAILAGNVVGVLRLLSRHDVRGALNQQDDEGLCPLHYAAMSDAPDAAVIVHALVAAGADVNVLTMDPCFGRPGKAAIRMWLESGCPRVDVGVALMSSGASLVFGKDHNIATLALTYTGAHGSTHFPLGSLLVLLSDMPPDATSVKCSVPTDTGCHCFYNKLQSVDGELTRLELQFPGCVWYLRRWMTVSRRLPALRLRALRNRRVRTRDAAAVRRRSWEGALGAVAEFFGAAAAEQALHGPFAMELMAQSSDAYTVISQHQVKTPNVFPKAVANAFGVDVLVAIRGQRHTQWMSASRLSPMVLRSLYVPPSDDDVVLRRGDVASIVRVLERTVEHGGADCAWRHIERCLKACPTMVHASPLLSQCVLKKVVELMDDSMDSSLGHGDLAGAECAFAGCSADTRDELIRRIDAAADAVARASPRGVPAGGTSANTDDDAGEDGSDEPDEDGEDDSAADGDEADEDGLDDDAHGAGEVDEEAGASKPTAVLSKWMKCLGWAATLDEVALETMCTWAQSPSVHPHLQPAADRVLSTIGMRLKPRALRPAHATPARELFLRTTLPFVCDLVPRWQHARSSGSRADEPVDLGVSPVLPISDPPGDRPVAVCQRFASRCVRCNRALYALLDIDLVDPRMISVRSIIGDDATRLRVPLCGAESCDPSMGESGAFTFDGHGNACTFDPSASPNDASVGKDGVVAEGRDAAYRWMSRCLVYGRASTRFAGGGSTSYIGGIGSEHSSSMRCPDPTCPSRLSSSADPSSTDSDHAARAYGSTVALPYVPMTFIATAHGYYVCGNPEQTLYVYVCTVCKRHGDIVYSRWGW